MAVWSFFTEMMRMMTERLSAVVYQLSKKSNPVFRMLLLVLNWGADGRGGQMGGQTLILCSRLLFSESLLDLFIKSALDLLYFYFGSNISFLFYNLL